MPELDEPSTANGGTPAVSLSGNGSLILVLQHLTPARRKLPPQMPARTWCIRSLVVLFFLLPQTSAKEGSRVAEEIDRDFKDREIPITHEIR